MPFPTYESKAAIPAGAEDVYEEKDGKWVPKLPDVSKLEETLVKVRAEKSDAEKRAKTAEEAKATAEREREAYKTQLDGLGNSEAKVAELLKKYDEDVKKAVAAEKERADALDAKVRTLTLDQKAAEAFVAAGGRPEKAAAALKLYKDRLDLSEDRPVVKDDKGTVTTRSLDDFFKEDVRKEMPEFYSGTKASGGGAGGINNGTGGAGGALTFEEIIANPSRAFEVANAQPAS
jgi:hypothetical protein